MKKALVGAALLLAPFFSQLSHADIYQNAQNGVLAQPTRTCMLYVGSTAHVPSTYFSQGYSQFKRQKGNSLGRLSYSQGISINEGPSSCQISWSRQHELKQESIDDDEFKFRGTYTTYSYSGTGYYKDVNTCSNLGNNPDGTAMYPNHKHIGKDSQGQDMCFTKQSLVEADTCSDTSADESYISSTAGASCMPKEDGSICPVSNNDISEITVSDGTTHYFYKPDLSDNSGSCYGDLGAVTGEVDNLTSQMPTSGCENIGGMEYCAEQPVNACDSNGNCAAGCGTVSSGGTSNFVCASPDFDGDGVPDYLDPDKDGDGIPNDQDLDNDNDGQDDPVNPYSGGSTSTGQSLSRIEGLLSTIAQNSGSGSGGSGVSGPSASQIGEEVGEKLTEIGDFSTSDYEGRIDAMDQELATKTDEFLQKDENDLSNAFNESEFSNEFTELKSLLAPNSCTANIDIPLTNSNLDLCSAAAKAKPFLWVIFAISTFIYCVRRIQSTARAE